MACMETTLPESRTRELIAEARAARSKAVPPFTVRPAKEADGALIDELFRASYGTLLARHYNAKVLENALPLLLRTATGLMRSDSYFVADAGGVLIGAGGWSQATPFGGVGPSHIGHMRRLAVRPEVLRCGIGSVILDHVVTHAENMGVRRLCALSTLTAHRFYEAQGFETSGRVDLTLRPGLYFPAVQMAREL